MEDIIFDGQYYYLFRSLNSGNKSDLKKGIKDIRTDAIRYFESYGHWGKYSDASKPSLEELYDHIKMFYRTDTNCISLSNDANVVLTYHSDDAKYVAIQYTQEEFEEKIIDARKYFLEGISRKIEELQNDENDDSIMKLLERIDTSTTKQEIISIVRSKFKDSSIIGLSDRQYLTEEENLKLAKLIGKLRILENVHPEVSVIPGLDNSRLFSALGNAFTSSEFINYGNIHSNQVIELSKEIIDTISILQQAKLNPENTLNLDEIILFFIELAKEGYKIDLDSNTFSNGIESLDIAPQDVTFLQRAYDSNLDFEEDTSIENIKKIFNLSKGNLSYNDSRMQLLAIFELAKSTLKSRAIANLIKDVTGEKEIEESLRNTFPINPKFVIKQNQRGHRLSNSVNLLINLFGNDLDKEITSDIIKEISSLSSGELLNILEQGSNCKKIPELLIVENSDNVFRSPNSRYFSTAIVEGYNWTKCRKLTSPEKSLLINRLYFKDVGIDYYIDLYKTIKNLLNTVEEPSQDEILAVMINIAIDGKINNSTFRDLLTMPNQEKLDLLSSNIDNLQTTVDSINIDLAMGRGKSLNKIIFNLTKLGIDRDFLESKKIHNIYTAQKIVETYRFENPITEQEKIAIMYCILNSTTLDNNKNFYLSTFCNNIENLGFSEQETYGAIINLAISGKRMVSELPYTYSDLIKSKINCSELVPYKSEIKTNVSEITIKNAISKQICNPQKIRQEFVDIGLTEFSKIKNIQNLIYAKMIVDELDFQKNLTYDEKKNMLYCLLRNKKLDTLNGSLISNLCSNLEKLGLTKQEIYAAVLNLSIYGNITDDKNLSYNALISSRNNSELSVDKKDLISLTKLNESTLLRAELEVQYENANMIFENKMILPWGLDSDFISQIDRRNLYTTYQIISNFNFGKELSNLEKKSIAYCILDNSTIGPDRPNNYLLSTAYQNLVDIGFSMQEAFGIILNSAIDGSWIDMPGFDFSKLFSSQKTSQLKEYINQVKTNVGDILIQKAVINQMTPKDNDAIKNELINLGISEEFLEKKYPQNMYMAKYIVDNYDFGRELSDIEKKSIIQKILGGTSQNIGSKRYLCSLCLNLEKEGFSQQEIFSTVINLAINNRVLPQLGYSYTTLSSSINRLKEFVKYKGDIDFSVSENTIAKACGLPVEKEKTKKTISKPKTIKENSRIIQLIKIGEILQGYNIDYSSIQLGKRVTISDDKFTMYRFKLGEMNFGENIDVKQIIEEHGLDPDFPFGKTLSQFRGVLKGTKRDLRVSDNLLKRGIELNLIQPNDKWEERISLLEILVQNGVKLDKGLSARDRRQKN